MTVYFKWPLGQVWLYKQYNYSWVPNIKNKVFYPNKQSSITALVLFSIFRILRVVILKLQIFRILRVVILKLPIFRILRVVILKLPIFRILRVVILKLQIFRILRVVILKFPILLFFMSMSSWSPQWCHCVSMEITIWRQIDR